MFRGPEIVSNTNYPTWVGGGGREEGELGESGKFLPEKDRGHLLWRERCILEVNERGRGG